MEISLLKSILNSISSFFQLASLQDIKCELIGKYQPKIEERLKLIKPTLDAIVDAEISLDEILQKAFIRFYQSVEELREILLKWQPLTSKVHFVLQVESLITKLQSYCLEILELLRASDQCVITDLCAASLEHCVQKIKHMENERISELIMKAIEDHVEGTGASSESLAMIADSLSLKSNQELLIEAAALEQLKENAEQAEMSGEVVYVNRMIALITHMHDLLVMAELSQSCNPVSLPADFCCPLSLEIMVDPVIVASGQTYERAFIQKWMDLGLTVCPKSRQALAHTYLIPNYVVKGLIAKWHESNNVKLPDSTKSISLNTPALLASAEPGEARRVNHFTCPDPTESFTSSRKSSIPSNENQQEGSSPFYPHSLSEDSLPGSTATGNMLDTGRISLDSCEDRLDRSVERSLNTSSRKSSIPSNENQQEGSSPFYPHSLSDDSLPGSTATGNMLDSGRISLDSCEDRLDRSVERSLNTSDQLSVPPSRSSVAGPGEQLSNDHNWTDSASSTVSNSNISQGTPGDGNEVASQAAAYGCDTSGEFMSELEPAANLSGPQGVPDLSSRLETGSHDQEIRCHPSERCIPSAVSSPAVELTDHLVEVETQIRKLVEDLKSSSLDAQRTATAELRLLAKHNEDNRIVIANYGAITLLVNLMRSTDSKLQENAVTALLNLSINDKNRTAITNADTIDSLIHVLETGSLEAKENSAATLFSLSEIAENKIKIGRSRAIKPLVDLLETGTPGGKKDAVKALFNLSKFHENQTRIVQAGAVKYLIDLMDPAAGMVDKAVALLSNLATTVEGRAKIGQEGGIPVLVEVVELGSARAKENAAAALLQLCTKSSRFCNMVLVEGAIPPLVALSLSGTPRGKEKAQALLSYLRNQRRGQ